MKFCKTSSVNQDLDTEDLSYNRPYVQNIPVIMMMMLLLMIWWWRRRWFTFMTDAFLCIIQMHLYSVIVCDVLQYNSVNVSFVSFCHLANTNEKNKYNSCYWYSLGGRQLCQNFELNGLLALTFDFWPLNGVMSHPYPGLPCFQRPSVLELGSGTGQTDRQTDRQTTVIIA